MFFLKHLNLHKLNKLVIVLVLVLALLGVNCVSDDIDGKPDAISFKLKHRESASTKLKVNVYLDATDSMKGYVVPGDAAEYCRMLPYLSSSASSENEIEFFKFGGNETFIIERTQDSCLSARKPDFYTNKRMFKKTFIDKVIETTADEYSRNSNLLSVIVTDLFQDENDVVSVKDAIKQHFLKKKLSVGIAGFQSDFSGLVHDVGIKKKSYPYKGKRPLYVIALGKHIDIENYFQNLWNRTREFEEKNFLILSEFFIEPQKIQVTRKLQIDESSQVIKELQKDNFTMSFRLSPKAQSPSFSTILEYKKYPFLINLNPKLGTIKSIVEVKKWSKKRWEDLKDTNILEISKIDFEESLLYVDFKLSVATLPRNNVLWFGVELHPELGEKELPQWVLDWNMDISKIGLWENNLEVFDGSKTLNLKPFILDLLQTIYEQQNPQLAQFSFYVKRND